MNFIYAFISIFNVSILYYLYLNRFLILDTLIFTKIYFKNQIKKWFKTDDYQLKKMLLYTNLEENYDVTNIFNKKYKKIKLIDNNLLEEIYQLLLIKFKFNKDIRLKIFFTYKNINYIIYFSYNNHYIPYPPYSEDILNNFRNDIVLPYYSDPKKKYFHSLFLIECKNILSVSINDIENDNLLDYFDKIQTPFHDFGILYKNPVKLRWILFENNINLNEFSYLYLRFLNFYFNEDKMELIEHSVNMDKNDVDKIFISDRIKEILSIKNSELLN